jgi:hypothetical protein
MDIKKVIFELENKLQQPDVRKSVEQLNELVSEDLIEFGSSGQVYTKKDVLNNLPAPPPHTTIPWNCCMGCLVLILE